MFVEIQYVSAWALTNITLGNTCHAKFHASEARGSEDDLYIFLSISMIQTQDTLGSREYARGRRERRNLFRPADVAFFSSESDKNVALIFRKIRWFNINFNIHTCHQLVFDLGRSSTRYPSGLHKKSICCRGPVWEGS